jgi:hypothetical protein
MPSLGVHRIVELNARKLLSFPRVGASTVLAAS